MPATLEVKLEGMTELLAAMRRLPLAVRGEALEHAVKAGAQVTAQAVSEYAGGAFQSRTGKLLRAIRQGVSLAGQSLIQVLARSPEYVLVQVWPRLPYTHLVEGGHRIIARGPGRKGLELTPARGKGGRFTMAIGKRGLLRRALLARRAAGARGQVAARAFVGPAFEATKEAAGQRILEELWQQVEREWAGGR